jgi:hypothetical protein
MSKSYHQNVLLMTLSLGIYFSTAEIFARAFFPEFTGDIHSEEVTRGKRFYQGTLDGLPVRVPSRPPSYDIYDNKNIILVVGDSISFGYGHAYEDIFWQGWQRIMELEYPQPPKIVSLSAYGNNFVDNFVSITEAIQKCENRSINVNAIIYQFNYNDLLPYTSQELRDKKHLNTRNAWMEQALMQIRQRYLNRSVFQRVMTHYIAKLLDGKSTDCGQKDLYPYAFGPVGFEKRAEEAWRSLEAGLANVRRSTKHIPFFILISPIANQFNEKGNGSATESKSLANCATIEPRSRLVAIAEKLDIVVADPTDYMTMGFQKRLEEGNPAQFFFLADPNHLNEIGSKYLFEYSYARIIKPVLNATRVDRNISTVAVNRRDP